MTCLTTIVKNGCKVQSGHMVTRSTIQMTYDQNPELNTRITYIPSCMLALVYAIANYWWAQPIENILIFDVLSLWIICMQFNNLDNNLTITY